MSEKYKYQYLISYVYEEPQDNTEAFGRYIIEMNDKICSGDDIEKCEDQISKEGKYVNVRILSYQLICEIREDK